MNEQIKNGGPAFPVDTSGSGPEPDSGEFGHQTSNSTWQFSGMTLRDYFAAHCPPMPEQWYLDSPRKKSDPTWHWGEASAAWAIFYADAMLRAREVQP